MNYIKVGRAPWRFDGEIDHVPEVFTVQRFICSMILISD